MKPHVVSMKGGKIANAKEVKGTTDADKFYLKLKKLADQKLGSVMGDLPHKLPGPDVELHIGEQPHNPPTPPPSPLAVYPDKGQPTPLPLLIPIPGSFQSPQNPKSVYRIIMQAGKIVVGIVATSPAIYRIRAQGAAANLEVIKGYLQYPDKWGGVKAEDHLSVEVLAQYVPHVLADIAQALFRAAFSDEPFHF